MAQHNTLGTKGEATAIAYLEKNGYTIVEQNYRYQKAEIDIIAAKNNVLAIVEVKTRSTTYFGDPQDFINAKKIQLLVKAADYYVIEKDLDVDVRFDVIAITKTKNTFEITHLEDAFLYF